MLAILERGPTIDLVTSMVNALPYEALNWAVAWTLPTTSTPNVALGSHSHWAPHICTIWENERFNPTADWRDLGKAIERTEMVLSNHFSPDHAAGAPALHSQQLDPNNFWGSAHCFISGSSVDTWRGIKVAACRSIVLGHLCRGSKIDLPTQLLDPANVS